VGGISALAYFTSRSERNAPGEQDITIDLAPAMELVATVEPAEPVAVASPAPAIEEIPPPDPLEEIPPPEPLEAVAPDIAEAQPIEAESPAPEVVVPLPPPPERVLVDALEKPPERKEKVEKEPPPKKAKPKEAPERRRATQRRPASAPERRGRTASSREDTGGAAAAADPNVLNRYAAQLASALRARLRYPEAARVRGLTGVASIRFTMSRTGQILSAALVRSTGHAVLDQAAMRAAAPGTGLPPAPDALPQRTFTFSVPLRFTLR
jgi:protein TonB